jgi:hypothetical protein
MLVIRTAGCRSGMPIQESRDDQLPAVLASLSRDDIFHQHAITFLSAAYRSWQ